MWWQRANGGHSVGKLAAEIALAQQMLAVEACIGNMHWMP